MKRTIAIGTVIGVVLAAVTWLSVLSSDSAAVAADPPAEATPPADPEDQAIENLLNLAWSGTGNVHQSVRFEYESRRKTFQRLDRWDYAYGLALIKLKKFPAAVLAFQSAIQASDGFSFSPWKAAIWTELALKRYDAALKRIESLAAEITKADFSGSPEEQERIATWIGQTTAAIEKLNGSVKVRQELTRLGEEFAKTWDAELLAAYDAGREYTESLYAELMDELKEATDVAKAKEDAERDEKQTKLKEGVTSADAKREELNKQADQIKQAAEEQIQQLDRQLQRLERDYNYLQNRATNIVASIGLLQNSIATVQQQIAQRRQRNSTSRNPAQLNVTSNIEAQALQQMHAQVGLYEMELYATSIRAAMVVQRAMEGIQQRNQTIAQAQLSAADLAGQAQALSRWQERMNQAAERLKQQTSKGDSVSTRSKRAKAKSLSTYLEFDPDWERIELTERTPMTN